MDTNVNTLRPLALLNMVNPATPSGIQLTKKLTMIVRYSGNNRDGQLAIITRPTDQMWKLMDAVCSRWGSSKDDTRFFIN
jgi:hypothetical protein